MVLGPFFGVVDGRFEECRWVCYIFGHGIATLKKGPLVKIAVIDSARLRKVQRSAFYQARRAGR